MHVRAIYILQKYGLSTLKPLVVCNLSLLSSFITIVFAILHEWINTSLQNNVIPSADYYVTMQTTQVLTMPVCNLSLLSSFITIVFAILHEWINTSLQNNVIPSADYYVTMQTTQVLTMPLCKSQTC